MGTNTRTTPRVPDSPAGLRENGDRGPRTALVAGAGLASKEAGQGLTTEELVDNLDKRRAFVNTSSGHDGDAIHVASITASIDPDRYLAGTGKLPEGVSGDYNTNTAKVEAVVEPQALTAAGVCAPYAIDYSMQAIGTIDRPVKDGLPGFVADRGGVQFRRDVDAVGGGPVQASGTWSLTTDANPGGAEKAIWDVPCNDVISAEVQAVTLGCRFSNITARFDPEATAANLKAATVAHARYAERLLLGSIYSQCTATFMETGRLGATRDILVAIDKAQAYVRDSRRIGNKVPLRVILPTWVLNLFRADLTRALHTSNLEQLGVTDQTIMGWFERRGITVTWTLDGRPQQAASGGVPLVNAQFYPVMTGSSAIPGFPDNLEFALFPEGAFIYLDGGTLDIGLVRDSSLVSTNRYIEFTETFEGIERKGVEAVRVVADVAPRGASAGTVSTGVGALFDD